MADYIQSSKVDWDVVDEELDRVPAEFKDPRFDSLRHVLDILSAVDAEAALEELKLQQERIEELVDNVVQGYHNGFNKAIHNYSQILHLFAVSKEQVTKVRSQLEDAKRRMGAQSRNLESQWKRSVTLGDTVKLMGVVQSVIDIPQRVQKLEDAKDWPAAVTLLLDGCGKLGRPEMARIGALKEIKKELAARRNSLMKKLVAEMERCIYEDLAVTSSVANTEEAGKVEGVPTHVLKLRAAGTQRSPANGEPSTSAAVQPSTSMRQQSVDSSKSHSSSAFSVFSIERRSLQWLGSMATKQEPTVNLKPAKDIEAPIAEVVACVAQLGGIAEVQATLRRHLPTQIRNVVLRALQASQRARPAQLLPLDGEPSFATDPATAQAAYELAERAFDHCLQVLRNLLVVLRLLGFSKTPPTTSALELLTAARLPESAGAGGNAPPATQGAYVRREADYAWECMQKEAQHLLNELLQPSAVQSGLRTEYQKGGTGASHSEGGMLSFSFDVQLQGVDARALLRREDSVVRWEGEDMTQLLRKALWGQQGSQFLTAHVYLPAKMFAEDGANILAAVEKQTESSGTAWFGGGERSEGRRALRTFLVSLVENGFLPTVFVDFRNRCSAVLDDPETMRARAKQRGTYSPDVAGGRPVLPAARTMEAIVEELLLWATLMPAFAARITGMVENLLGRMLDGFQARLARVLGKAACHALSEDPTLAILMAAEPGATQAGEPVAFFVGKNADTVDSFVATLLHAGFGTGGEAAEISVLSRVLQERPVRAEALLSGGDTGRIMDVAALADSLDYLADVIHSAVLQQGDAASQDAQTPGQRRSGDGMPLARRSDASGAALTEGLAHLVDRYRSLGGQSLRALRLEMLLLIVHHLGDLPKGRYMCDAAEAQDVDECVGALQRAATRAEEDLAPFLPPEKRAYVFGGMAAAAARFVVWLLPELKVLNQAGLARMCRMLAVLQPFLAAMGATGGLFRPEAARQLERARAYYAHLTYAAPALIAAAAARPTRFLPKEYLALLEVNFVGRNVTEKNKSDLAKVVQQGVKHSSAMSVKNDALGAR